MRAPAPRVALRSTRGFIAITPGGVPEPRAGGRTKAPGGGFAEPGVRRPQPGVRDSPVLASPARDPRLDYNDGPRQEAARVRPTDRRPLPRHGVPVGPVVPHLLRPPVHRLGQAGDA